MTAGESVREAQLRLALAPITTIAGLVASTGASLQYWLGTGFFRPWALAMHLMLFGVGLYWFRNPPQHPSRSAFFVNCYLSTLVGTFVLKSGDISSLINLAMVSIAASFAIPDRRYLAASQGVVFAWVGVLLASPWKTPSATQLLLVGFMLAAATAGVYLGRARSLRLEQAPSAERIPRELVHDVNNLLGGILGGADLALASADHPDDVEFALRQIRERALATRDYIRDAATPEAVAVLVSPNEVVARATALAIRGAGERIKLIEDHSSRVAPMELEHRAIERAVYNLVLNAIEASPPGGGEVRVRTRWLEGEGQPVFVIRVEDDGVGIAEPDRLRVFESGFTTGAGEHQGLGLAYVAAVVARHDGVVFVDDAVGSGTAIEIQIPIRQASRERRDPERAALR